MRGIGAEVTLTSTEVTAAASVPFSSTLRKVFCLTRLTSVPDTDQAVRALLKERERDGESAGRHPAAPFGDPRSWSARPRESTAVAPVATPPAAVARAAAAHASKPPSAPRASGGPAIAAPAVPATSLPTSIAAAAPVAPAVRAAAAPRAVPPALGTDVPAPPLLAAAIPLDHLRTSAVGLLERLGRLAEHRRAPAALIAAGVMGLFIVLVTAVRGGGTATAADASAAALPTPQLRGLVGGVAVAEQSGFRHIVAGIDSLRRAHDVVEVPPAWLEGRYLADAPSYPEVREYWLRYGSFLDSVQARDAVLCRAGLVAQLRSDGVEGPVLSLRLNRATREFEQTQPARESTYLHMQELVAASLVLHDLLVERADDISYEPASDRRRSRDPVVEAVPLDTVLRDRMWILLDRIFASLEHLGGELGANRNNLTEALLHRVEATREH